MAGIYPDVPAPRIPYDLDGSVGLSTRAPWTWVYEDQLTPAQLRAANGEGASPNVVSWNNAGSGGMVLIFPQLMDILGAATRHTSSPGSFQWSPDTTNGLDGTWTTTTTPANGRNQPMLLRTITPMALEGVKAIRFTNSGGNAASHAIYGVHLYGYRSAVGNRLEMWDPSLDQPLDGAHFDWGDTPRATSADRYFRIKNRSASVTYHDIEVSLDAPSDTTPSVAGQHLLSADGENFAATITIPTLAPGAISPLLTLRRVLVPLATLNLWTARVIATPGSEE